MPVIICFTFSIRTQSVKFLEGVVLLQTYPEADSMVRENDFNLEDIPLTLKIARRRRLEEEARFVQLMLFRISILFLNCILLIVKF